MQHLVKLHKNNVNLGIIYVLMIVLLDVKIDNVQILVPVVHHILIPVNNIYLLVIVVIRHVEVNHYLLYHIVKIFYHIVP